MVEQFTSMMKVLFSKRPKPWVLQLLSEIRWLVFPLSVSWLLSGCYIMDFFDSDKSSKGGSTSAVMGTVTGTPLGKKAGGVNEEALEEVYAISAVHAPAAVRPDPDLYVRNLLKSYRDESVVLARQVGRVENYRLLLGGASEDFSKTPQTDYDATSLLAVYKVAQEVCIGLVAPNWWVHKGWETILPNAASAEAKNILWLAQRFLGKSSADISQDKLNSLQTILDSEEAYLVDEWWGSHEYAKYVPVCATLAIDAEALYL